MKGMTVQHNQMDNVRCWQIATATHERNKEKSNEHEGTSHQYMEKQSTQAAVIAE